MIFGIKGDHGEIQALRYPKEIWTASAAEIHCRSHGGSFEAASGVKEMNKSTRLLSTFEIKSFNEEQRIIEGIASSPRPDRMDDTIDQDGIEYELPLSFLYHHDNKKPIGDVTSLQRQSDGKTYVRMKIADPDQFSPNVATWIREAWELARARLLRGLSIGFRSLDEKWNATRGGFDYLRLELLEVSLVTIPANAEATILTVKSYDSAKPAAISQKAKPVIYLSNKPAGASAMQTTGKNVRTIEERIAACEAKRAANVARKDAIAAKSDEEGKLMDASQKEEFDNLALEVKAIDDELLSLKEHQQQLKQAVPVSQKTGTSDDLSSRPKVSLVTVKGSNVPQGMAFTRFAMAMLAARGERQLAYDMARANKDWKASTPEVERFLSDPQAFIKIKDAVAAGTTTTSGWASQLADYTYMASQFIEFLRPMTVLGRIPSWRMVPFNIKVPVQSAGGSANWVGEGLAKPVTKLTFTTAQLRFATVASIIVLTEQLVRHSSPAAEGLVRTDMAAQIRQFLDEQFLDPTVTAVANVSPASITNGAGHAAASGTTADNFRYDLQLALQQLVAANIDTSGVYIIMQSSLAVAMSLMRNALGGKEFPDLTVNGGNLEGFTVVTSQSCPSGVIVIVQPSEILLADEGGISVDVSREATIVMDDGTSPTVTTTVNLWQQNLVGLRVEREITWLRRRDPAVYYITSAAYSATSP